MNNRIERAYIHGTAPTEQDRLALLNGLTNPPFLEFLGDLDGSIILEVGSGLGILASEVARLNSRGLTVGVELSREQVAGARFRTNGRASFSLGDAHSLPFRQGSFDRVYCRYLLEHTQQPLIALWEMRRVLRPGGRLFAQENNILISQFYPECPTFDTIWREFAALQHRLGGDALIGKKLYAYFIEAGFHHIELSIQPEVHWYDSPGFRPWLDNLIGNVRSAESALVSGGSVAIQEIETGIRELEALRENPAGSAYFYWNRATGVA